MWKKRVQLASSSRKAIIHGTVISKLFGLETEKQKNVIAKLLIDRNIKDLFFHSCCVPKLYTITNL